MAYVAAAVLLAGVATGCAASAEQHARGEHRAYVPAVGYSGIQPPPTPTIAPTAPAPEAWAYVGVGRVTRYGYSYEGLPMGCGGTYRSADPYILAVGPARYAEWPCGTVLRLTGPAGVLEVARTDSCPGCGPNLLDLSEAGHARVCGAVGNNCQVTIETKRD